MFKYTVDTAWNEYRWGGYAIPTLIRPQYARMSGVWARWDAMRREAREDTGKHMLLRKAQQYSDGLAYGKSVLTEEELEEMKAWFPDAWWQKLDPLSCPGCGNQGRAVGPTFEPPRQSDIKAWAGVAQMLQDGCTFDRCGESRAENRLERQRVYENSLRRDAWDKERRERIEKLRNVQVDERARGELRIS